MAVITYIILLALVNICVSFKCPSVTDKSREVIWEEQLIKDLMKDYDSYKPPKPINCEAISVRARFILKYFNFDSDEEILSMQTWMYLIWHDERLTWKPEDYGGLVEIEMTTPFIWAPSFRLYNSADSHDFDRYFYSRCTVKHEGEVVCVPKVNHNSLCGVKLTYYPYDVQECHLIFGTWPTKNEEYHLNFSSRAMSMMGKEYGSQWFISDYRQEVHQGSVTQLNMTFVLEREAVSLAAVIVYPALIVSGLTIACLFLDVRRNVRLILACFSLGIHYYWISQVSEYLPKYTADPPNLLLYYRGSMILTVLTLVTTFVLGFMCGQEKAPHNLMLSVNGFVYGDYVKFLVFPSWDVEEKFPSEDNFNEDWIKFANSVNRLFAFVIVIAYIGMYFALVPQPVPIDY